MTITENFNTPFGLATYNTDGRTHVTLRFTKDQPAKIGRCKPVTGSITFYFGESENVKGRFGERDIMNHQRWCIYFSPAHSAFADMTDSQRRNVWDKLRPYVVSLAADKVNFDDARADSFADDVRRAREDVEKAESALRAAKAKLATASKLAESGRNND